MVDKKTDGGGASRCARGQATRLQAAICSVRMRHCVRGPLSAFSVHCRCVLLRFMLYVGQRVEQAQMHSPGAFDAKCPGGLGESLRAMRALCVLCVCVCVHVWASRCREVEPRRLRPLAPQCKYYTYCCIFIVFPLRSAGPRLRPIFGRQPVAFGFSSFSLLLPFLGSERGGFIHNRISARQ